MSGGISGAPMTLQDFLQLYQPNALPIVQPQAMAPLGQGQSSQEAAQPQRAGGAGQGQGQKGGAMPFLGQLAQIGGSLVGLGPKAQAQSGQGTQGGLGGMLGSVLQSNGANGSSNMLADVVGFSPFGGGGWGSGE